MTWHICVRDYPAYVVRYTGNEKVKRRRNKGEQKCDVSFFVGKFRLLQISIIVKNSSQLNRSLTYVYKFWFLSISLKKPWPPFRVILLLTQTLVRLMASHVWDISWCSVSGSSPISPLSLSDFTNLQINGFTLILR